MVVLLVNVPVKCTLLWVFRAGVGGCLPLSVSRCPAQAQCSPARCCGVTLHTHVQMLIKSNPRTLSVWNLRSSQDHPDNRPDCCSSQRVDKMEIQKNIYLCTIYLKSELLSLWTILMCLKILPLRVDCVQLYVQIHLQSEKSENDKYCIYVILILSQTTPFHADKNE